MVVHKLFLKETQFDSNVSTMRRPDLICHQALIMKNCGLVARRKSQKGAASEGAITADDDDQQESRGRACVRAYGTRSSASATFVQSPCAA